MSDPLASPHQIFTGPVQGTLISKEMFEEWKKNRPVLFASGAHYLEENRNVAMRFFVYMNGEYSVMLGMKEMYKGRDFELAASTYNLNLL